MEKEGNREGKKENIQEIQLRSYPPWKPRVTFWNEGMGGKGTYGII
jgi:hypothetical protein